MGGFTRHRAPMALLLLILAPRVISAQSSDVATFFFPTPTGTASPSSTASSEPKVIDVTVNKGSTHRFDPEDIQANVGDVISFHFYPTNHSVVKAEYGYPCVPYDYVEPVSKDMFFSGNRPMQAADPVQVWNLTLNSTAPVFFYCSALESCNKQGMLGVINSNKTMTLDHQRQLALEPDTVQLSPGDPIPAEASATIVHSTPTAAPTSATSAPAPLQTAEPSDHHHSGLSGGAIAGIAVAAVAAILICGLLFFYMGRTKSLKDVLKRNSATIPMSNAPQDPNFPGYGYMPQQQHDYRQSNLPPYGSPYTGPPSEAPGSPGFTAAEYERREMASPTPEEQAHKAALASHRVQQDGPAELASEPVPEKRADP
ncbi:uncharacterized protein BDZ99DRAFT_569648 [Mytilinidion resinicola]|uniref:Extracellular serine-rich protein n=1 Tax=Mytilinidion resinicola TaxID=574789 RepID=A0A6A6YRU9_9PEZI|nr:uncharacterized protein BDZ99DRAFT_569648 [Mytilinidion resinicola]KAF2811662.1 hypothetical protein BDZ99DRAFT_569648 [Mytilinidion resinicola]